MKRLERKHPLAIRWFHWINFPVIMTMIWSGILIYWANSVYRVGIGKWTLFHFFPDAFFTRFHLDSRLAEGQAWHFTLAWVFALNGIAYVLFVLFSGEWRYLLPTWRSIGEGIQVVLHDLGIRKQPLPRQKFNAAQRIAYTGVVVMGFGSLVTGLTIYKPVQFALVTRLLTLPVGGATGYELARWLHFWLTMGFCGFFLVHIAQVARAGWNNFRAMITGYEIVRDEPKPAPAPPVVATPVREEEIAHVH